MEAQQSDRERGRGGEVESVSQPLSPGNYAKIRMSVCQPGSVDGRFAVTAPLFRFGSSRVAWLQKLRTIFPLHVTIGNVKAAYSVGPLTLSAYRDERD